MARTYALIVFNVLTPSRTYLLKIFEYGHININNNVVVHFKYSKNKCLSTGLLS